MKLIPYLIILVFLSACAPSEKINPNQQILQVDTLYINGVIWTGEKEPVDAEVMAVKNGFIAYVGNGDNIKFNADNTIDLKGNFLMPGFIDNHVHFFEGGAALASVDLRSANSPEDFTNRIIQFSSTIKPDKWILNGNWDHENWGGRLPNKSWIDAGTKNNPVFVIRVDGHIALANSKALELASINDLTKNPDGGEIERDEQGLPTGILKGNALNLVLEVIPKPSNEDTLEIFRAAQNYAHSLGLTKVHAMTANPTETTMLDSFRLAQQQQQLTLRVTVYTPIEHWQSVKSLVASEGRGNDMLNWGGVKGFVDGSLGASTAWFYDAYQDKPTSMGGPLTDPNVLTDLINGANQANLNLAIHAIGDRAIDDLISKFTLISMVDTNNKRFRIEHFQHPTLQTIENAARYGIILSMQPYHAIDDGRWAVEKIGPKRIKTAYAFRSILDAGGLLSFGSDWPVAPLSPLAGIYAAVTRQTTDGENPDGWLPQQKITVEEALKAYTYSNAYSTFDEHKMGTLLLGKFADFVVLSKDPRQVKPELIPAIEVLSTTVNGKQVFSRESN